MVYGPFSERGSGDSPVWGGGYSRIKAQVGDTEKVLAQLAREVLQKRRSEKKMVSSSVGELDVFF